MIINEYYEILGVSQQASLQEIKSAYRNKAKKIHPDVNPSKDAQQQFVLLSKAYQYICDFKEGKIKPSPYKPRPYSPKSSYTHNPNTYSANQRKWANDELEKKKAWVRAQRAKKEAEDSADFKKYKKELFTMFLFVSVIHSIISPFSLWNLLTLIFVIVVIYKNKHKLKKYFNLTFGEQMKTWSIFFSKTTQSHFFTLSFSILFSLIVFFTIVINTLIPMHYSVIIYLTAFILPFGIAEIGNKNKKHWLKSFVLPLAVNLFFTFNYTFSYNPQIETYKLKKTFGRKTTLINLHNNTYEDYLGIRVFFDYNYMAKKNTISFLFEEGLFGIKVMKEYTFFYRLP
ncbi:MAG: DnaJ domain-containing protein [Bacteroidota bacterium]|nr:DnaJ domain-containing protein [Bacteroidota bacterium]